MKLDDFIKALYDAGWRNCADAQHDGVKKLHRRLWPVIAELEQEVFELDFVVSQQGDQHVEKT